VFQSDATGVERGVCSFDEYSLFSCQSIKINGVELLANSVN
jgi:hypothetical protein